jgi:hypothetical protein
MPILRLLRTLVDKTVSSVEMECNNVVITCRDGVRVRIPIEVFSSSQYASYNMKDMTSSHM